MDEAPKKDKDMDEAIDEELTEIQPVGEAEEEEAEDDSEESEDDAEAEIEDAGEEAGEEDALEGDEDLKDLSVDQFKDMIRDIIAQEVGGDAAADDMDAGDIEGMGDEAEDMEEPGMEPEMGDGEEEIDLDELLKEITEMNYEGESHEAEETASEEVLNEVDPVTVGAGVAAIFGAGGAITHLMNKLEAGEFGEKGKKLADGLRKAGSTAANIREDEVEEVRAGYGVGEFGDPMENDLVKAVMFLAKHAKKAGKKVGDFVKDIEVGKMSNAMKEVELEEASELEEAMKTVEELKGQLQEVNLLNAKLLYVNKVFKASSLTESQKVSVIAAFDKAETVKEVKLVFETVSDNVVGKATKSNIKEAKLGRASKATGTTASKPEVILEVSDAVKRMQKLAGII